MNNGKAKTMDLGTYRMLVRPFRSDFPVALLTVPTNTSGTGDILAVDP